MSAYRYWMYQILGAVCFFLILLSPSASTSALQNTGEWSEATNLSSSETQSINPSMAVDPSGRVHVVWSEDTGDGRSFITYTYLENGRWMPPNEIMTSPYSQIALYPSIASDSRGYLHLVWRGDGIAYSQVYAPQAGIAQNWSDQQAIENLQSNLGRPQIVVGPQDILHVVYEISVGENSGIYYVRSDDGGRNWIDPIMIYQNRRSDRMISDPRLAVGADGSLHIVWVEANLPESFPPIGIRYASSIDGGKSWGEPISLADGPYSFPAIITRGLDEVHVVYSGTSPDRYKFHRWSGDGGQTWSETFRNTEIGGYQGFPALAVDSNERLHWLTTASIYSINNDGIYHTEWKDEQWSPGEVVLRGKPVGQNPWDVAAEVAFGNELHIAVQYPLASSSQPEGWQEEIYAMRKNLAAPYQPPEILPSPTQASSELPTTSSRTNNNTIHPTLPATNSQPPRTPGSPLAVIGTGLLASMILTFTILLLIRRKR